MSTVLTIGTFDLLHPGHVAFLEAAAKFGDLYVGVNTDEYAATFKQKPIMREDERLRMVQALRCVKHALFYEPDFKAMVEASRPTEIDYVVIGSDWASKNYNAQLGIDDNFFKRYGIQLIYLPYTPGISSTEIRQRVLDAEAQRLGLDSWHPKPGMPTLGCE